MLNAHLLENPGGGSPQLQARTPGRAGAVGKPSFAELWLPDPAGSGESDSPDSKWLQFSGEKEMLVHSIQVIYNGWLDLDCHNKVNDGSHPASVVITTYYN